MAYAQVTEDAKATLEGYADGYFDVIILDLCDPLDYGPCYTLYSREFYDTCAQKLSPNGMGLNRACRRDGIQPAVVLARRVRLEENRKVCRGPCI